MKKSKTYTFIVIALINIQLTQAQDDIHFTQFNWIKTYLNPAMAGQIENGNMHFAILFRDQSFTVTPNEYQTLMGQMQTRFDLTSDLQLGLSALLSSDRAGDGNLRSDQLGMSAAMRFNLSGGKQIISIGIQPMWIQRQYGDIGAFVLEEELQQGINTEVISNENYGYIDFNCGIAHEWNIDNTSQLVSGLSIQHLNNKHENSANVIDKYPLRLNVFSQYRKNINSHFSLIPRIHYQRSAVFQSIQFQTLARYKTDSRSPYVFNMGLGWRYKDALQFIIGIEYKSWNLSLAYDNNTSGLRAASGNISALEIGISYAYFRKKKSKEPEEKIPIVPEIITPVPVDLTLDLPEDFPQTEIKLTIIEKDSIVSDTLITSWPLKIKANPYHSTEFIIDLPQYFPDTIILKPKEQIPGIEINRSFEFKKRKVEIVPPVKEKETPEKEIEELKEEIIYKEKVFILENIYYDFDDDKILEESEEELTDLLNLLNRYPDLVIELSSHTDVRGSDDYNIDLSNRRAKSAAQWLFARGVDPKRVIPKGYGETRLINHCEEGVPCSDDLHRKNRRTEFKIIAGPKSVRYRINTKTN